MRETNWVRRELPGDRENKPSAIETLEEIADRLARQITDNPCSHPSCCPRTAKVAADILSALRNERESAFDQGYVCAVANIMTLHGEDVIAREVLNQNRPKDWSIIDRADMEALQPIFDHEAALAEIEVRKSYKAIREGR